MPKNRPCNAIQQIISLSIYKSLIVSHRMQISAVSTLVLLVILSFSTDAYSTYSAHSADKPVKIIAQSSFVDSEGRTNIVGTVRNTGTLPVEATVGLAVQDKAEIWIEQQHS